MSNCSQLALMGSRETAEALQSALGSGYEVCTCDDLETALARATSSSCKALIVDAGTARVPWSELTTELPKRKEVHPIIFLAPAKTPELAKLTEQVGGSHLIVSGKDGWQPIAQSLALALRLDAVEHENALLRQISEQAEECILLFSDKGRVTLANGVAGRAFGYTPKEMARLSIEVLFPPGKMRGPALEMIEAHKVGSPWSGEVNARRHDGTLFPVHVSLACAINPTGTIGIIHARDVTDQQRLLDRLKQLSVTDDLTGAYNVRYLWPRLRYEFLRARRYQQPLSCLMVDLDRFKSVNDTHGHRVGDEVLRMVTQTMAKVIRQVDIAARYGGEEFAIILPSTDIKGALHCAESIRAHVELARHRVGSTEVGVTVSVGAAELTEDQADEEEMLRRADQALMTAKSAGRNRTCGWSQESTPPSPAGHPPPRK